MPRRLITSEQRYADTSYIGTSRYPLEAQDYEQIIDVLLAQHIDIVLFNGGNGTMDACGKLARAAAREPRAEHLRVVGIQKLSITILR